MNQQSAPIPLLSVVLGLGPSLALSVAALGAWLLPHPWKVPSHFAKLRPPQMAIFLVGIVGLALAYARA